MATSTHKTAGVFDSQSDPNELMIVRLHPAQLSNNPSLVPPPPPETAFETAGHDIRRLLSYDDGYVVASDKSGS